CARDRPHYYSSGYYVNYFDYW
nr:immunoglobulin heavy chain junction region [Macaca mulatta]MOW18857.1 immunoglobulin heavy chain junction region [Macaca mulatta]MOW19257.1 immunoglobulin heavy chain junction region [Macaca mulatta]MOW19717.1 immunoglobulin heavy chain junction region [Macaca mulatta]MOW19885.1 immunoglobulin heavy chain junction region [Macaca mulatta]